MDEPVPARAPDGAGARVDVTGAHAAIPLASGEGLPVDDRSMRLVELLVAGLALGVACLLALAR